MFFLHEYMSSEYQTVPELNSLPNGWHENVDSLTGKIYYWNDDGRSQWEKPTKHTQPTQSTQPTEQIRYSKYPDHKGHLKILKPDEEDKNPNTQQFSFTEPDKNEHAKIIPKPDEPDKKGGFQNTQIIYTLVYIFIIIFIMQLLIIILTPILTSNEIHYTLIKN